MMCRKNLIAWLLVLVMLIGMVPVQALAAETATSRIDAQQIVLGEDLTMRFLASIADSDATMKISVAGEEVDSYAIGEMTPNADGYYEFATDLAAAQMTDVVNLKLTSGEEVLLSKDYSVQQYADALLAGGYSNEVKAMARQMLYYGAAAQTYFGYNTENPVSVNGAVETEEIPAEAETAMVAEGIVEGIEFRGASLVFRSKVAIRFYFKASNGVEGYTFAANGEPCEVKEKGELYYVEIPSVSPADYGKAIDLTVSNGTDSIQVSYSPLHYLINMNKKETSSDSLKALLKAMYNYHLVAVEYTNGDSSVEYPYNPVFAAKYGEGLYIGNCTVALGDLFAAGEDINENAVVDVSAVGTAAYTPADSVLNWADGTVTFSGTGAATVTVNGTALTLTVENTSLKVPYEHVTPEFTAKYGEGLYIGNCTVALGDLFSANETIDERAIINVEASGAVTYNAADSILNWADGTVTFSGTGAATITVNGTALTLTVENNAFDVPYQRTSPTFASKYGSDYYIGNQNPVMLGTLFYTMDEINAKSDITVTVVNPDGTTKTELLTDYENWASYGVQFSGTGEGSVSVNNASLKLKVENTSYNEPYYRETPEFEPKFDSSYYIGNQKPVVLGDLFETSEVINAKCDITVVVQNTDGTTKTELLTDYENWASYSVQFTGTGMASVRINGQELQLTVENTSLNTPYHHVWPAFTADYGEGYYIGNCTVSLDALFSTNETISEASRVDVTVSGAATYNAAASVLDWASSTVTFSGTGEATITVNDTPLKLIVENNTQNVPYLPAVAFAVKLPHTDKYLYRVGNGNTVALGSLFTCEGSPASVNVTVEALDGAAVSGAYTANSDWTKGTLQFTGTGPVKVTINETELLLEVVNAINATSAASATANSVVLLNDVSISTVSVSNGYTLYGNGFTMTAANDVLCTSVGTGFVVLDNGILDNVQLVCPNFAYSVVYQSNMTASDNYKEGEWYGNTRSAVLVDGNSTIRNSYIHGGRAALYVRSGNILVDNSTISGGAAANIHAVSAKSLTLRDVTLIQEPHQATVHDTSKTVMGLSGLFECDSSGACTPLILEGTLVQHAWIDESDSKYIPSGMDQVVSVALSKTNYLHDIDGNGTKESLNLGFTYVPQNIGDYITPNITDNRTDKATIPYEQVSISSLAEAVVYSYTNGNGTASQFIPSEDDTYDPSRQGPVAPAVTFSDTSDTRVYETAYAENGWSSTLTVDLDAGNYSFSFANLVATKFGKNLSYTVKTADGTAVDTAQAINLTASGVRDYVLTISDNLNYNAAGALSGETAYHTYYFTLTSTKTSIPEPEVADTTGGTPLLVVKSKDSDWSCAIPALEGIKVKYYTSASASTVLDLATLTPSSTGKQNGTNNFWEITKDGYTLKVTCGYIHDSKQVYGMPVVVNNGGNKMYFTISSTNGYVSTSTSSRTVTLTYEFTDPNGKTLTFSKTWQFNYADYKDGTQYSYSSFANGTLKEASGGCVTPDTLVTLADGTQKEIQYVTYADELLVWNFYTGTYDVVPASIVMNHGYGEYTIATLKFDDGTVINAINGHGFFDVTENKYVILDEDNAADYIGHEFVKVDGDSYSTVKLADYSVKVENTESWSILTAGHYNCIMENMWTLTPAEVVGSPDYLMPYEVGEGFKYDEAKMKADIEKYGLYTYEDFAEYVTEEQFYGFGFVNWKVSVGKGFITWEDILYLLSIHVG